MSPKVPERIRRDPQSQRRDDGVVVAELDLALTLQQQGKFGEAQARYERVLSVHPRQPTALYRLALIRAQSKDFLEAARLLKKAARAGRTIPRRTIFLVSPCWT